LCHDDVVSLDERRILSFADFHGLCVLEDGPTADKLSTSILEKRFNTLVETVNDAFFPTHEVAHLEFSRAGNGDAHVPVFFGVLRKVVEGVGCMNEGFAGDATSNETGSSGSLSFDDDGFQAELCRTNGSDIATGACTDNKDLALLGLHLVHLT
jgi:hypothetical protein